MERINRDKVRERFRARRAERKTTAEAQEWDVVVTCHRQYLGEMLNQCLRSWDREKVAGKRILVLDDCGFAPCLVGLSCPGWEVVSGRWGNPSGSRNAGLAKVTAPWVVFWDADNDPRRGLAREFSRAVATAPEKAGYIGPGVPDGDPRDCYGVDTNALWNVKAVTAVGGWENTYIEDWRLGWRLANAGFRLVRMHGEPIHRRLHGQNRTFQADEDTKLWAARDFAILSLHRGDRKLSEKWLQCLDSQELPPRLGITLVVDADDDFAGWIMTEIRRRFQAARIVRRSSESLPAVGIEDVAGRMARHRRVFDLYQAGMAETPEAWVFTWEDDVFPQCSDLLRKLNMTLRPGPKCQIAVVGAAYAERYRPDHVCASRESDRWVGDILLRDVTKPRKVGSTAAGLTLWRRSDWEAMTEQPDDSIGWDFAMNRTAQRRGWQSWLLPDLCEHAVGEAPKPKADHIPDAGQKVETALIDSQPEPMLKNQILQLVLPALVAQLIRVLDEKRIKQLADDLISRLEQAVESTPSKIDDATVLPLAKHVRSLLD
ncbi:glycosyltransferase family 2 protein [bacterium]|nr:glycosyltransferase family 2 protein [bacterium]